MRHRLQTYCSSPYKEAATSEGLSVDPDESGSIKKRIVHFVVHKQNLFNYNEALKTYEKIDSLLNKRKQWSNSFSKNSLKYFIFSSLLGACKN